MHVIAAKAVAFGEALQDQNLKSMQQSNCIMRKHLAEALKQKVPHRFWWNRQPR